MSERDQEMGDALRRQGWRQGSTLTASTLDDFVDALPPSTTAAVVISQDCVVVRECEVEPCVELLCGDVVVAPDNRFIHAKHPRVIHLTSSDGATHLAFDIRRRVSVEKHRLASHAPDSDRQLNGGDIRSLAAWVARRYTRPTFPDKFNDRLKAVDDKLERLVKHECSRPVTAVYVMLEDFEAELPPERCYEITLWFSCHPESLINEVSRRQIYEFARRYVEIVKKCPGISVVDDEVRGEDKINLSEIQVFRRLEYDCRSLAAKPGGDLPAPDR